MTQIFDFLCGNFEKVHFIYGIKNAEQPWHYFEEQDSIISVHSSLPAVLDSIIGTLDKVRTIKVPLVEKQWLNYYENGKFVFKNSELKTYMYLTKKESESKASYTKSKNTDQMLFITGQSNPLLFFNSFEKCTDLKTEKEKMFKIRNFVDACHKVEFSELYFTSDWPSVRQVFIKKYASSYTEHKKKELTIDFNEETTLRSFFERKLKALSYYTTLPFLNQIEMILVDFPNSVSKRFLVDEVMTKSKSEILDFCDSIQDMVQTIWQNMEREKEPPVIQDPLDEMEVFTFDPELELQSTSMTPISPSGSSIVNAGGSKGGRPGKRNNKLPVISESDGSSQSSMSFTDNMSVDFSPKTVRAQSSSKGKITKRGRGRPRKNFIPIPEENSDSVSQYLNEISDASSSTSKISNVY